MKIRFMLLQLFLVLFLFGHVSNAKAEVESYTFGVISALKVTGFQALVDHLEERLKVPMDMLVVESYDELIEKIGKNDVQFAILGPSQYVEAKWRYPELKYIATPQTTVNGEQRAYYFGTILVRKDSGITEIEQLQNKSFAFIDPNSASGYRFPRMYLYKRGINPKTFFSTTVFAGTHPQGTDLLAAGNVDAVSTWDLNLWSAEQKYGYIFRPIARIGPIVQPAVVANHTIQQEIISVIQKELLELNLEELSSQFSYTGFSAFSDKSYDIVREIYNFPFLDTLAPNLLNEAVQSQNLNLIFKGFDELNYQKDVILEFIKNELLDKVFTVTGKITNGVENISYGDGWYSFKKGFHLSFDTGRELYIKEKKGSTALEISETVTLRGKIIGVKGFDTLILERVEEL